MWLTLQQIHLSPRLLGYAATNAYTVASKLIGIQFDTGSLLYHED